MSLPAPSSARTALLLALALLLPAAAGCIGTVTEGATAAGTDADDGPFSATDVFAGDYDTSAPRTLARGPHAILSQEVALVPSELDGTDIMIYVMRPDVPDGQRVPVIIDAGPYFPAMQGLDLSGSDLLVDFVSHGYAFALVSVRGTGDSGGCMDLMGPAERHDVDQAVTWLGTQEWSNGNVGMFGGSYDGSTQWQAASTGNPHLKTIVPLAGIPDLFSFMVRNGSVMTWTPAQFALVYWGLYGPVLYNPATGRSVEHTAQQLVCPESMKAMAGSVESALLGERDSLGWFEARDWRDDVLENYQGTVFLVHGFQDVTVEPHAAYPFVNELEASGIVVKHMLGPWGHELPWRADSVEIMLRWYDRWLKEDASVDIGPRVQVLDNVGGWRSETSWPPADAAPLTLHLRPDLRLASEDGGSGEPLLVGPLVPVHDPSAFASRMNAPWKVWEEPADSVCPACPRFETEALGSDLRFAGSPRLHITVTPTGPGGHVTAILRAIHPDGSMQRVGMGQMDLRFAEGDGESRPVVPGQAVFARMELQPTDAVVPAGSKLVLELHQGSYGIRLPSTPTYPVLLDAGAGKSTLALAVFERGPDDMHEAPARIGEGGAR